MKKIRAEFVLTGAHVDYTLEGRGKKRHVINIIFITWELFDSCDRYLNDTHIWVIRVVISV